MAENVWSSRILNWLGRTEQAREAVPQPHKRIALVALRVARSHAMIDRHIGLFFLDGVTSRKRQFAAQLVIALSVTSCDRIGPSATKTKAQVLLPEASAPASTTAATVVPSAPVAAASASPTDGGTALPAPAHTGPWLTVLVPAAAIYAEPKSEKDAKLGYAQSGARLAVKEKPKPGEHCPSGWAELVNGGYLCTSFGTLDDKDPRTRFTLRLPNIDGLLPYTYARNAKNGTPLYRTVPSREQMRKYEPYLAAEAQKAKDAHDEKSTVAAGASPSVATSASSSSAVAVPPPPSAASSAPAAASPSAAPPSDEDENTPWWQRQNAEDKLHENEIVRSSHGFR